MRLSSQSSRSAVALLLLAGASVACSDARATATDDEFARDLQLASSTVNLAMPPVDSARLGLENAPKAAPEPATVARRAPGPRVVRSETPTVAAAPVQEIGEAETDEAEVIETVFEAPVPVEEESMEPVVVAPRPTAPVIPVGGDYGGTGGGVFGGTGGRGGVVIRGGGVDGDNCELHRTGRRGPIYMPRPTASMPTTPTTPTVDRSVPRTVGGLGGARSTGRTAVVPSTGGSSTGRATVARPRRIGG